MKLGRSTQWVSSTTVILILLTWVILTYFNIVREEELPKPETLVREFTKMAREGYGGSPLLKHVGMSMMRAGTGFVAAALVGIPVGLLMGRMPLIAAAINPVMGFMRPIPPIAFITLFIFYFGIGEKSKIGLIFMASLWYVILNCADGVRSVPDVLLRVGQNIGLNQRQLFTHVILRAALPYIMTGVRAASSISWNLVVASELIGAAAGLGFIILDSAMFFNIPATFIGICLIGLIGLILEIALSSLQHRLLHWQGK